MSSQIKIGILGRMGSGKTSLANEFIKQCPYFVRLAFADKVKQIASELFQMKYKDRRLLQNIGGKMREINPDVWANYVINKAKGFSHVVVDDVRYENEVTKLREAGFTIIYLDIDRETQLNRLKITYPDDWETHANLNGHDSEKADQYQSQADLVVKHQTRQEMVAFVKTYLDKTIIKVNNAQALNLELKLNQSPYGNQWDKLGDRLYKWSLDTHKYPDTNPDTNQDTNQDYNFYYISKEQANFIRDNLDSSLGSESKAKFSLVITNNLKKG